MRSTNTILRPGLLGLCALLACSGNPSNAGVDSASVDSVAALLDLSVQRYCDAVFRCTSMSSDLLAMAVVLETKERCVSVFDRLLASPSTAQLPQELLRLEAEGHVHVDAAAVARCYQSIGVCAVAWPGAGYCRELIEGTVPSGAACNVSEECAGDAYCDYAASTCPGVCSPRVPPGGACDSSVECGGDGVARCVRDSAGQQRCTVTHTSADAQQGQPCTTTQTDSMPCAVGLFCDVPKVEGKAAPSGTCRAPLALGAACDDDGDACEAGAICHGPSGAQRCQQVQRVSKDSPCDKSDTAPPRFCDPFAGLTCGASGCEPLGDGSLGARCGTSDFDELIPCRDGLYCDRDSKSCQPLHASSEACDRDAECASGSCDDKTATCRERYCSAF